MKQKRKSLSRKASVWLFVFICGLFCGAVISTLLVEKLPEPSKKAEVDVEKVILAKLTQKQVDSRFTPVLLYRADVDSPWGELTGVGTLCDTPTGKHVITAEHLFSKKYGKRQFGYRSLQPLDDKTTGTLSGIANRGSAFASNGNPDIITLTVGKSQLIECFSERYDGVMKAATVISPVTGNPWMTSLISGRRVDVIGICYDSVDNASYFFIDDDVMKGESGSGYVDKNGLLYILSGQPNWPTEDQKKIAEATLKTTKPLVLVYGPIKVGF